MQVNILKDQDRKDLKPIGMVKPKPGSSNEFIFTDNEAN